MNFAASRTSILVALLVLPFVGVFGYVVWQLHTPNPKQRTPIVITRSSLLPHRYAGPCMNCHRILPAPPQPINWQNLERLQLTQRDRQLVAAGQRVESPSITLRSSVPAITRSDILAHSYLGVCSNCHVVLDIRPSALYMKTAMERAREPLLNGKWTPREIAHAGAQLDRWRSIARYVCGFAAETLLLLCVIFVLMRMLKSKLELPGHLLKQYLVVHEWTAVGFSFATLAHWYFSDRGNNFLHISLVVIAWLTASGLVLHTRLLKGWEHRSLRLVHTQRLLFVGLLVLLVVGHLFSNLV